MLNKKSLIIFICNLVLQIKRGDLSLVHRLVKIKKSRLNFYLKFHQEYIHNWHFLPCPLAA